MTPHLLVVKPVAHLYSCCVDNGATLVALNYVGNGSPNIQLALNSISKHKSHNDLDSKVVLTASLEM